MTHRQIELKIVAVEDHETVKEPGEVFAIPSQMKALNLSVEARHIKIHNSS